MYTPSVRLRVLSSTYGPVFICSSCPAEGERIFGSNFEKIVATVSALLVCVCVCFACVDGMYKKVLYHKDPSAQCSVMVAIATVSCLFHTSCGGMLQGTVHVCACVCVK